MRLFSFLLIFMISSAVVMPQKKYFVFFKDKGMSPGNILVSNSPEWKAATDALSPRSIERRLKTLGPDKIVGFDDIPVNDAYLEQVMNTGTTLNWELKWFNCISINATEDQIAAISKMPFVEYVRPVKTLKEKRFYNRRETDFNEPVLASNSADLSSGFVFDARISPFPGDDKNRTDNRGDNERSLYGPSWKQYKLSDLPMAKEMGYNGKGVVIGVMDSGFDWKKHRALTNLNVIAEYDFVKKDNVTANEKGDPFSQHNHGTFCLSVLGGYDEGKLIGPSHKAQFILAKTEATASETLVEEDNYAAALIWMDSIGVDITSSSLGYTVFDDTSHTLTDLDGKTTLVTRAAEKAFEKGILVFTASGNSANEPWFYVSAPGDGVNTLAVGAVDVYMKVADFSSGGPTADGRWKPDFVTAGVDVYGATAGTSNKYEYANGTSSATPIASGIAGLLLQSYPYLTNVQMRSILIESAERSFLPDNASGYGLLSALKILTYPNIETRNGSRILHKRFANPSEDNHSVELVYNSGNKLVRQKMTADMYGGFETEMPAAANGKEVKYWFEIRNDKTGETSRDPDPYEIYVTYGNDDIVYKSINPSSLNKFYGAKYFRSVKINKTVPLKYKQMSYGELAVYDMMGNKVKTIFTGGLNSYNAGYFGWDGKDARGFMMPNGIYYYQLSIDRKVYARDLFIRIKN